MLLWIGLAMAAVFLLMGGMRAFERAKVTTIKSFAVWVVALGGLTLTLLLFLTGRGGIALGGLTLFGPLLWQKWRASQSPAGTAGSHPGGQSPSRRPGWMSPDEALQILGLKAGAAEADIREAHKRLMRAAHPDSGGSDWLAARVNQARDVLLGGRK
jgi:DnaJ family protein C protein 19